MVRVLASAITGFVIATAIFLAFIIPSTRETWRTLGRTEGRIDAYWEVATKLRAKTQVQASSCKAGELLFSVKTTVVHAASCNGVQSVVVHE